MMLCEEKIPQPLLLDPSAVVLVGNPNHPPSAPPPEPTLLSRAERDRQYHRQRYLRNRDAILAQHKEYKRTHRAQQNLTRKRWRKLNPEKEKAGNARFRAKHHAKLIQKGRERYRANPEKHKNVRRHSYWRCRARERAYNIAYSKQNRSKIIAQRRERERTDPQFAIGERLRRHLVKAILRWNTQKADSTFAMLGCSLPDLMRHLEAQFLPGMTLENRSQWHVDHFIPVAAFDVTDAEEQRWAYYFKNLRPLWPSDNYQKSDTLPNPLPSWLPAHIAERILSRHNSKTVCQNQNVRP